MAGAGRRSVRGRRAAHGELVAARVPEIPRWWFAFQSQGASGGPWIGPSVEETLDAIAAEGVKALVLQPIGFLCDHVEILFDVDHLFREYAVETGCTAGAAGVAERLADAGEGGCGPGARGAGTAPEDSLKCMKIKRVVRWQVTVGFHGQVPKGTLPAVFSLLRSAIQN